MPTLFTWPQPVSTPIWELADSLQGTKIETIQPLQPQGDGSRPQTIHHDVSTPHWAPTTGHQNSAEVPGLQAWEPPWRVDPSHSHQIQGADRAGGWALRDPRACPKGQWKSLVLVTQLGISQKSFPQPLTPPP